MCWLFEGTLTFCAAVSLVPTLSLLVGACWLMIAFVKDISDDVLRWYLYRASHRYQWELKVRFYSVVQLYAEVKQLSMKIVPMLLEIPTFAKIFFLLLNLGSLATSMPFSNSILQVCS